ncbi:nitronate monooxygenase [Nonomuraea sp. NN258]|uniref:NAD(P)H-dependent flavin oxidoreductase n=1 Tax=Nonomuraea antri TaxID=2730852 RepID=UPI0015697A76|nr:nitronate monooxygenase [Nonomuraea antri]NRQ39731.1 nitronate monooxygenase [Nonomuraea antri]
MTDWTRTRVSGLFGTRYPIVQGPFGGGVSTVALTAAVSAAGGLGSYGGHHLPADELDTTLKNLRAATDQPFAVNLWVPTEGQPTGIDEDTFRAGMARLRPWYDALELPQPDYTPQSLPDFGEQVDVVLEHRPAVFSFVFGLPGPRVLAECRRRGIVTVGAATNLDEGRALADARVDVVVASGVEAGGHRPSFLRPAEESVATGPLTAQLAGTLRVPVIAAGGIADGRGIAAAFALGAEGAQVGTAFLATEQSGALEVHKRELHGDRARYTLLTRAFSGRHGRGIRNAFLDAFADDPFPGLGPIPPYPQQLWLTAPLRAAGVDPEVLFLYAGQGAPLLHPARTDAGDLLRFLAEDTDRVLARLATLSIDAPRTP